MTTSHTFRRVRAAGALLLCLTFVVGFGASAPARAQLAVEPGSLSVILAQDEEATRTLTLTNTGSEPLAFCLSFERPLQRIEGDTRLAEGAAGGACGALGEILYQVTSASAGIGWDPYGLTMMPDGRLFAADNNSDRTHELTPELEIVRSFEHPFVDELDPFPATRGVTYNSDTVTLWWLNVEERAVIYRVLLLEGDFNGTPTGRRIELPITEAPPPSSDTVDPYGISYDPATARYYYVDFALEAPPRLWAMDTLGGVIPDYPVGQDAYPTASSIGFGPDAHGDGDAHGEGEPAAVRIELAVNPGPAFDRLVVVDPGGHDLHVETPLPDLSGGSGFGSIEGNPVRSRIDPNGVLYFAFTNFDVEGVVGIRPHPLPPSWLAVEAWDGTLEPGESTEIALTFRPGERSVGDYTAVLQAFEAATGQAAEIPLSLAVTTETHAEEPAVAPAEVSLAVYPNPSSGRAVVAVGVPETSEVRVVAYDVLGRRVATLAEGELSAGTHRLRLDAARLPAGLYLVRAEVSAPGGELRAFTERLTVVR